MNLKKLRERLDEILKELEDKGSKSYNELAEIILTAKERRTK